MLNLVLIVLSGASLGYALYRNFKSSSVVYQVELYTPVVQILTFVSTYSSGSLLHKLTFTLFFVSLLCFLAIIGSVFHKKIYMFNILYYLLIYTFLDGSFLNFIRLVTKAVKTFCENFSPLKFTEAKWWHNEK